MVNPLKMLWKDTCTIQNTVKMVQPDGSSAVVWATIVTDEPCKLSFLWNNVNMNPTTSETYAAQKVIQQSKLFIRPDLNIPEGSRIAVTRDGLTYFYRNSGKASRFTNHQEIIMEVIDEWA